jgi:uncharacterized protein
MNETPARPNFAADRMLGKLARYLRMIGCDTSYPGPMSDSQLLALARRESRAVLTRDRGIMEKESARAGNPRLIEIQADDVLGQMRQLAEQGWVTGIGYPRCPLCNTIPQEIPPAESRHLLHPFTVATQGVFLYCPSCNLMFWQGSHWEHFQEMISKIFPVV